MPSGNYKHELEFFILAGVALLGFAVSLFIHFVESGGIHFLRFLWISFREFEDF